jgi:hypothetical protein
VDILDEFPIGRHHWVSSEPHFPDLKVFDDIEKAIEMIVVSVR